MSAKNITLPFITKTQTEKERLTYSAEVAYITCMAEMQRKKTSFLRDVPEKLVFLAKLYYPLWVVPAEKHSLILDGLGVMTYKFSFKEPTTTAQFIEEVKKNSVNPEEFLDTLENQTRKIDEVVSSVILEFKAVIADRELLAFLVDYFKTGESTVEENLSKAVVPMEVDEDAASKTGKTFINWLRIINSDVKGIEYALNVLKEETTFHKNAASREIEWLEEKCENEVAAIKPEVDKRVKKLVQKHDRVLASIQISMDKKVVAWEKKREHCMRKLQNVEKRKEAVEKRREKLREKKTSVLGTYEVEKCEREINSLKKEVRGIDDAIDKIRKETGQRIKNLEEEHRKAIAQEESKITQIVASYQAKISAKQKRIEEIEKQTAAATTKLNKIIDELNHSINMLRQQVEVGYKLDDPEKPTLVILPVYLMKYIKDREERFNLFSPIAISEEVGVLTGLRKIITFNSDPKMKVLTRFISKHLHEVLNTNLTGRMQVDGEFKNKINTLCLNNNIIDTDGFPETLNEGLDELVKRKLMTEEEAQDLCKRIIGGGT
ncbi:MAG: hypothetical protein N3D85_03695 [Candidatus Bathyarchaeota archaeon]|nr:hypothetical protein [Candidatus Bathyarchaeota archaeon]